jgi:hypothetical protein
VYSLFDRHFRAYAVIAVQEECTSPSTSRSDGFVNGISDLEFNGTLVFCKIPIARTKVAVIELGSPVTIPNLTVPGSISGSEIASDD